MPIKKPNNMYRESAGLGVDAFGDRAEDPSKNVAALSEAANKRQDDLREANDKLIQAQLSGLRDIIKIRAECAHELVEAESRRVSETLALRADYSKRLEEAESKRIDAIRAVDVNAVAVDRAKASDQASVLAAQVAQTAEALRALVATTANTVNQSQQQLATALSTRITTLEQAQYKGEGQSGVRDPQMVELMADLKAMRGTKSEGISATWAVILGVGALIAVVIGVATFSRVTPSPQTIYAPPTVTPQR